MSVVAAKPQASPLRRRRSVRARRLRRYLLPGLGALVLALWVAIAIWAPVIAPYDPVRVDVVQNNQAPSAQHWLGTDELGRDVLSRVIFGSRISLFAGLAVVIVSAAFGILLGAVAAYARGLVEEAIMRLTDLVLCFPPIILAMAIAAALGIGVVNTLAAIIVVWWPKYARLARSLVIGQRSLDYVAAGQVVGLSPQRILFRHIMPNAIGPLIVLITLDIGGAIITFAGLNFLGLGVVPPTPEWGAMVSAGRELLQSWWIATFPGLAILTVVLGSNFVGDGLRDWLDPKARLR